MNTAFDKEIRLKLLKLLQDEPENRRRVMDDTNNIRYETEDEIDLIQLFLVLWKRKMLIISGTLICVIFAVIYSLYLPKIYQVQMKVRPGYKILGTGYLEELTYVKGKIDANVYDQEIKKQLSVLDLKQISNGIDYNVSIPKNSDILDISLEVADVEFGKKLLQTLYPFLVKDDEVKMKSIIDEYDQAIQLQKIELGKNTSIEKLNLLQLDFIDKKIADIDNKIDDIKANTNALIAEQKKVDLSGKNAERLPTILLSKS